MVLANGLCLCGFTLHQTTSKLNREIGSQLASIPSTVYDCMMMGYGSCLQHFSIHSHSVYLIAASSLQCVFTNQFTYVPTSEKLNKREVCNKSMISWKWLYGCQIFGFQALKKPEKNTLSRTFYSPKNYSQKVEMLHCLHQNFPEYPPASYSNRNFKNILFNSTALSVV